MRCKKCGTELEAGVKFCPQCGEKVKLFCTECGEELIAGIRFCPSCGKRVVGNVNEEKNEVKKNESVAEVSEDKLASGMDKKEDETDTDVKRETAFLGVQGNEGSKTIDSNRYNPNQEEKEKSFAPRSQEEFLEELNQLASRDEGSKGILNSYNTKLLAKHLYPYLRQKEELVALRHIVHHNFATVMIRGGRISVDKFLVLTDERVIKFVRSYWLKPKIRSCYLSEISSIEAARPGNVLKGLYFGERLRIKTPDQTIKLRTFGKGSAEKIEREILRIIPDKKRTGDEGNRTKNGGEKNKAFGGGVIKFGIIGSVICACMIACVFWFLRNNGTEVSECLSLKNADVMEWLSKSGLEEEVEDMLYKKDGLSIMLDDDLNVYTVIMEQPECSLYGLKVGEKYAEEKSKLEKAGYRLSEKEENAVVYEAVKGKGDSESDGLIILELDDNELISKITYLKENEQSLFGETDEEGLTQDNGNNIISQEESHQRKEPTESSTEEAVTQDDRNGIMSQEEINSNAETQPQVKKLGNYIGVTYIPILGDVTDEDIENQKKMEVLTKVLEDSEVTIPEELIQATYEEQRAAYEEQAQLMEMDLEAMAEYYGMDMDTFESSLMETAARICKQNAVLKAIAQIENIAVGDEDRKNLADSFGYPDVLSMIETVGEDEIDNYIMTEKVVQFIADNAIAENTGKENGEETQVSSGPEWVGTYIAEDDQAITVSFSDDSGVTLTFVGYGEEGWYTSTKVLPYKNADRTQVSDPEYYDGTLMQETVYTLTETGIEIQVLPNGGWTDGFYFRQ